MHLFARWTAGFLVALLSWTNVALAEETVEIRLKHGDDPRWAAANWDDRDWQTIAPGGFPARAGVYWVRMRIGRGWREPSERVESQYTYTWPDDPRVDSLFLASVFSFELYWDGRLLERSGTLGNSRADEVPGPLDHLVRIPDDLRAPGEHVIALRMSSHHYNFPATHFRLGLRFVNHSDHLVHETRRPIVPLGCMAGALLMAVISEVLFRFIDRRRTLRLCGAVGVTLAIFYGLIACRWLYNAPYSWHSPRLVLITIVLILVCGLLLWLVLEQLAVARRRWWLAALVPLLAWAWTTSPYYEVKALWICRASLAIALVAAAWAIARRRRGAVLMLVGLAVGLVSVQATSRAFLDATFFLLFEGLVLFVFAMIGVQVQSDRTRAREAQLTAARLELELLKKNIQPHFLLNTLATIVEVIEQDPKAGMALIEALAGEFRILARVAGEKLIPLAEELELCRAHLRVMSLRRGVRSSFAVRGGDDAALVPPALFHTLIENGLTHLGANGQGVDFELIATRASAGWRYVLLTRGEARRVESSSGDLGPAREGTGTRYIKARLAESFGQRWTLRAGACEGGWQTVIEVPDTISPVTPVATPMLAERRATAASTE